MEHVKRLEKYVKVKVMIHILTWIMTVLLRSISKHLNSLNQLRMVNLSSEKDIWSSRKHIYSCSIYTSNTRS